MNIETLLVCKCKYYNPIDSKLLSEIEERCKQAKTNLVIIQDLCQMVLEDHKKIESFTSKENTTLISCNNRTIESLFYTKNITLKNVKIVNRFRQNSNKILDSIPLSDNRIENPTITKIEQKDDWIPWFPIIDTKLCSNCRQCHSYCLFGVYSMENGKVTVTNPANCKTNCPACARICPNLAIIFPKHTESPIDGSPVDTNSRENLNLSEVDIKDLLNKRRAKKRTLYKKGVIDDN